MTSDNEAELPGVLGRPPTRKKVRAGARHRFLRVLCGGEGDLQPERLTVAHSAPSLCLGWSFCLQCFP